MENHGKHDPQSGRKGICRSCRKDALGLMGKLQGCNPALHDKVVDPDQHE